MDLNWIDDLLSLTETRSFSRSADARNITQSTLSKRIRALEEWVGTELVDRRRYPVDLTPAGVHFVRCGREVSRKLRDARASLQRPASHGPMLRIAAGHSLASHFLPSWWKSLTGPLAQTGMRIHPVNIYDSALALVNGDCDLLLAYHHDAISLGLDTDEFDAIEVGEDAVIPVSAPAANGNPQHRLPASSLHPIDIVQYAKGAYFYRVVEHILEDAGLSSRLRVRCESDMVDVVKALALAGHGMAWLPRSCVQRELHEGTLLHAGGELFQARLTIRCWRARRHGGSLAQALFTPSGVTA